MWGGWSGGDVYLMTVQTVARYELSDMAKMLRVLILGRIGEVRLGPRYGPYSQISGLNHETGTKGDFSTSIGLQFVVSAWDQPNEGTTTESIELD